MWQPVFPVVRYLKLEHTTPPPARTVHQVTLSSCARRLPDSVQSNVGGAQEGFIPVVRSSIQCFLPAEISSSSKHCISDCFRPCFHMLHSIAVVPLVRHSLGALHSVVHCRHSDGSCRAFSAWVSALSLRGSPGCALTLTKKVLAPLSTLSLTHSMIDVMMMMSYTCSCRNKK